MVLISSTDSKPPRLSNPNGKYGRNSSSGSMRTSTTLSPPLLFPSDRDSSRFNSKTLKSSSSVLQLFTPSSRSPTDSFQAPTSSEMAMAPSTWLAVSQSATPGTSTNTSQSSPVEPSTTLQLNLCCSMLTTCSPHPLFTSSTSRESDSPWSASTRTNSNPSTNPTLTCS